MSSISTEESQFVREVGFPLYTAKGWLKFLGIISIIQGIFWILSLFGILFCWLPIWLGVLLLRAAGDLELSHSSGERAKLIYGLQRLKTYFVINGVLQLLQILFFAFAIIAFFGLGVLGIIAENANW